MIKLRKMSNLISEQSVNEFKTSYCNENTIIPVLLRDKLQQYFISPILDVGSGLGEISALALPDKEVIHLDTIDFSQHQIPKTHSRVVGDFFSFIPQTKVQSILMSHVLQYLDEDLVKLNAKLNEISPKYLITVTNTNQDFLGELIEWFEAKFPGANPERLLNDFPEGFSQIDRVSFTANLECPTYDILAKQVFYLFEIENTAANNLLLTGFLKDNLQKPGFTIDQHVTVYQKKD